MSSFHALWIFTRCSNDLKGLFQLKLFHNYSCPTCFLRLSSCSLLPCQTIPFCLPLKARKTTIMFVASLPRLIRFVLWPLVFQNGLQVAIKSLKFAWLLEGTEGSGRCWEYFNQQRKQLTNGFLLLLYCRVIMGSGIYSTGFKHDKSDNSCTGFQSAIEGGFTSVIFLFYPWAIALPTKQQELIWILFGKYSTKPSCFFIFPIKDFQTHKTGKPHPAFIVFGLCFPSLWTGVCFPQLPFQCSWCGQHGQGSVGWHKGQQPSLSDMAGDFSFINYRRDEVRDRKHAAEAKEFKLIKMWWVWGWLGLAFLQNNDFCWVWRSSGAAAESL